MCYRCTPESGVVNRDLTIEKSIHIHAPRQKVWEALADPGIVKQYFFGTTVHSDWKVSSPITFQGEWEGNSFRDKGTILEIDPGHSLKYSYWSAFSGLEDREENYSLVSYRLEEEKGGTSLSLTQTGFAGEEAMKQSQGGWEAVLAGLKQLLEES